MSPRAGLVWVVGELVAGYWNGTYRVTELWEVAGIPEITELEDWGWKTAVRLLGVDETGIPIDELDIAPMSLARATPLRLSAEQERGLRHAFDS